MANVILGLSHNKQVEICDVSLFTSNYLLKLWHKTHTHTKGQKFSLPSYNSYFLFLDFL